jgi:hypothetical protein
MRWGDEREYWTYLQNLDKNIFHMLTTAMTVTVRNFDIKSGKFNTVEVGNDENYETRKPLQTR